MSRIMIQRENEWKDVYTDSTKSNSLYKKGYNQALEDIEKLMYHQCFECDNDENMQKWDSGNWIRYKLFENVLKQLKEKQC